VELACPGMLAIPLQEPFHPKDIERIPGLPIPLPEFSVTYFLGIKRVNNSVSYTISDLYASSEKFMSSINSRENYEDGKYIYAQIVKKADIPRTVLEESRERATVKPSFYAKKRRSSATPATPLKKKPDSSSSNK